MECKSNYCNGTSCKSFAKIMSHPNQRNRRKTSKTVYAFKISVMWACASQVEMGGASGVQRDRVVVVVGLVPDES